jgi:hypothetical protein
VPDQAQPLKAYPGPEKNQTISEQQAETRIAGLQEALLTKQNLLEAVVAEKTSLVLKLEKVQVIFVLILNYRENLPLREKKYNYSPCFNFFLIERP